LLGTTEEDPGGYRKAVMAGSGASRVEDKDSKRPRLKVIDRKQTCLCPIDVENLIEEGEIDFVSMDVKAPLDPFRYSRSIGLPIHLNPILESIEILKRGKVECEFRMTVVPRFHKEEDIQTLGDQLRVGRRFVLQNFNPENPLDPSLKNVVPYDQKVLKKIEREVQEIL